MTGRTSAAALGIRRSALPAWHTLTAALAGAAVPCTGDPEAWWADDPGDRATAARACRRCPVLAECGAFATANHEGAGVWAGLDRAPTAGRPAQPKEQTA